MAKTIFRFTDGSFYRWNGENRSGAVVHKTTCPVNANDFDGARVEDAIGNMPANLEAGEFIRVTFEPLYTVVQTDEGGFFK